MQSGEGISRGVGWDPWGGALGELLDIGDLRDMHAAAPGPPADRCAGMVKGKGDDDPVFFWEFGFETSAKLVRHCPPIPPEKETMLTNFPHKYNQKAKNIGAFGAYVFLFIFAPGSGGSGIAGKTATSDPEDWDKTTVWSPVPRSPLCQVPLRPVLDGADVPPQRTGEGHPWDAADSGGLG